VLKSFHVSDELLDELAAQPASAETLALLRAGQLSKYLQLTSFIVNESNLDTSAAVAVISAVQRQAPEVAERVLSAPCFGSWAGYCARLLLGKVKPVLPLAVEVSYLDATAAVAAVRAGLDAELTLYVREGLVLLPGLGAVRVEAAELEPVAVRVRDGQVTLRVGGREGSLPEDLTRETESWFPSRILSVQVQGQGIELTVEDLDYYRDCYGKPVTGRMPGAEFAKLAVLLQGAWECLVTYAPERAREVGLGLRSLVPLSPAEAGPGLSATSATAYGAFGLTVPERPEHLAATLVHEFQHSKLSALLDLRPLFDKESKQKFFAPWKPEPRPLSGTLQGAFAFLAVSDFWGMLHQAGQGASAEQHFAELRVQVALVLGTIDGLAQFNVDGQRFVSRMRVAMEDLLAVPVTRAASEAARDKLAAITRQWQERNSLPQQAVPVVGDHQLGVR
jgi:HEXXH motif-containing protein